MSTFTVSLILVVAICVSILKPFIELKISPGSQLHDTLIRLIAIVVGLIASLVDYLVNTPSWQHGPALEATMGRGLVAGVGAVLTYHLLTADVWQTLTPGETTVPTTANQGSFTAAKPAIADTNLVPATVQKVEVVTPTPPPDTSAAQVGA